MSNSKSAGGMQAAFAAIVIPVAIVVAILLYMFVLGNPANFQDNNPELNPLPGNILGNMHKGGMIVPILMGCFLIVLTFSIERFITIAKSKGSGSVATFIQKI